MANASIVQQERNRLMKEIKTAHSAREALQKIAQLREQIDWAVPDYRHSLSIISDTTYQDRKHFLLELIQNADDAQFEGKDASITFIILDDGLELRYNEKGFSREDVFAITGTGNSTKKMDKLSSNSFIGEKGIGFKSVFALAEDVEIESPPWHFLLNRQKPVVPQLLDQSVLQEGEGTRIKVRFQNPNYINDIAKELDHFVSGEIESFLFLQKLAKFTVENYRYRPMVSKSLIINPADRMGNQIELSDSFNNISRRYILYSEELIFPEELVHMRWEKLTGVGPLKRKMTVAGFLSKENQTLPTGRLFCFLPTQVFLPVPLYLQVDGYTTANRESLHDLQYNQWNKYLVSKLPDFLLNAILFFRQEQKAAMHLPDYVPETEGRQQLAPVFKQLMKYLIDAQWIKTCEVGDGEWVEPSNAVIANNFLYKWIMQNDDFRRQAENFLGKKFMHPKWAENKAWNNKWVIYGISYLVDYHIARLLCNVVLPKEILNNEENLLELYRYLRAMKSLNPRNQFYDDVVFLLQGAPIYPVGKSGFGPLRIGPRMEKVFFTSTRAQRYTGLEESLGYTIINPEFTYKAEAGGGASDQRKLEIKRINERNNTIRDLLLALNVQELNEESLLRDLQIPWLLDKKNADELHNSTRWQILNSMFESFAKKRDYDNEYLNQLKRIASAFFLSEEDHFLPLENMVLPSKLRFYEDDDLYAKCGLPSLAIDDKFITPLPSEARQLRNEREKERKRKYREDWRSFLIRCGIKVKPTFHETSKPYASVRDFRYEDSLRCRAWLNIIGSDYTDQNNVKVTYPELDKATVKILNSNDFDLSPLAKALYQSWYNSYSERISRKCKFEDYLYPGNFRIEYKRNTMKNLIIRDKLWGGVKLKNIPLQTIDGKCVPASSARRVTAVSKNTVRVTCKLIPLVLKDETIPGAYHPLYLQSLNIPQLSMQDANKLWNVLDKENYSDIIHVVIECLRIGILPDGLEIFDYDTKQLRPYQEFRIGIGETYGIPFIEKQYGDDGRILGELLKLRAESKVGSYKKLIAHALSSLPKSLDKCRDDFYRLLKDWENLSVSEKNEISQVFLKSYEQLKQDRSMLICFNDENNLVMRLRKAGYVVLHLNVQPKEEYSLRQAAHEIGFVSLEGAGKVITEGERLIDEGEIALFNKLFVEYEKLLEPIEQSRLAARLALLGNTQNCYSKIKRVRGAHCQIEGIREVIKIPLKIPFLDSVGKTFLVDYYAKPQVILAQLLSSCEFTNYSAALMQLKSIPIKTKVIENKPSDQDQVQPKEQKFIKETEEIAAMIIEGMVDERQPNNNLTFETWRTDLNPEEEQMFREKQMNAFNKALAAGPIVYEQKAEKHNRRSKTPENTNLIIVDPDAIDPKAFLKAEYGGKCQLCGTQLRLSNGENYIETYHIREKKGSEWLLDRPFNILGLCPNCHALAKYGGGRDLINIYRTAQDLVNGYTFPEEVEEFHGDFYVITVKVNGEQQRLIMSKTHLNYFAVLVNSDE